jgi:hypothetical protein
MLYRPVEGLAQYDVLLTFRHGDHVAHVYARARKYECGADPLGAVLLGWLDDTDAHEEGGDDVAEGVLITLLRAAQDGRNREALSPVLDRMGSEIGVTLRLMNADGHVLPILADHDRYLTGVEIVGAEAIEVDDEAEHDDGEE